MRKIVAILLLSCCTCLGQLTILTADGLASFYHAPSAAGYPSFLTITNPVPGYSDNFGYSVAFIGNNQFIVGAYKQDSGGLYNYAGNAYLYAMDGTLLVTITNPAPAANDNFGSVEADIGGGLLVIGAPGKKCGSYTKAGQAFIYNTNGTLLVTISNPVPATSATFGWTIANIGTSNLFCIGAGSEPSGGFAAAGQAYIYDTNGTLLVTITNPSPGVNQYFGSLVSKVNTNLIVISADNKPNGGFTGAGEVFLYANDGTLLTTITNPNPTKAGEQFGHRVAGIGTSMFAATAYLKDDDGIYGNVGEAYIYSTNGTLLVTIPDPTPADNAHFGWSLDSFGTNHILVGASGQGAVFVYDTNGTLLVTITNPVPGNTSFGYRVAGKSSGQFLVGEVAKTIGDFEATGQAYLYLWTGL